MSAETVGVIGLGLMGSALAERLACAGFGVLGFDVDPAKGGKNGHVEAAASVLEIGRRASRILLAVYDTAQVESVLAALERAGRTLIVLCTTTVEPERIAILASRAALARITLIESPLSGTSAQVRAGEAVGLIAGPLAVVDAAGDLLDVLCPRRVHVGATGNAARAKLAVNLVLQLNRAALAEGIVFAERLGLEPAAFLQMLRGSPARSDVMDVKGEKMARADYAPQSHITQTLKDARLILDEGTRLGQRLPLMEVNAELLAQSIRQGGGERDSAAVIEAIRAYPPA